jgi:hypothetical protein
MKTKWYLATLNSIRPNELKSFLVTNMQPILPEEVITEIIKPLQDERAILLSLYKTSKQFRRLTIPILYGNVRLDGIPNIRKFLLRILRDRSLGLLVKDLTLIWGNSGDCWPDPRTDDHLATRAELEEMRSVTLEYQLDINNASAPEVGYESMVVIILLCSVPDLVSLYIKSPLERQSLRFFEPEMRFEARFLQKLEHYINWRHSSIGVVLCFFGLPSIRTMEFIGETILAHNLDQYCGTSPVEGIYLNQCSTRRNIITELSKVPRNLKHFSFLDGRIMYEGQDSETSLFGDCLDHLCESLETLSLVSSYPNRPAVMSFQNFKALTRLKTTFQLLPGQTSKPTSSLVDSLPPNLEHLELLYERRRFPTIDSTTLDDCAETVREFLQTKESTGSLVRLTRIRFPEESMEYKPLESLIALGADVGVIISN